MEKAVLAAANNDDLQVQKFKRWRRCSLIHRMKVLYSCWSICFCAGTF